MSNTLLRVSVSSSPSLVAGAIAECIRQDRQVFAQAIGAGAVNQMIKSVIVARRYLAQDHINIFFIPAFVDVNVQGRLRTAVRLEVIGVDSDDPETVPDKPAIPCA